MRRLTATPLMCALIVAAIVLRTMEHVLLVLRTVLFVLMQLLLNRHRDVALAMLRLTVWVHETEAHDVAE